LLIVFREINGKNEKNMFLPEIFHDERKKRKFFQVLRKKSGVFLAKTK